MFYQVDCCSEYPYGYLPAVFALAFDALVYFTIRMFQQPQPHIDALTHSVFTLIGIQQIQLCQLLNQLPLGHRSMQNIQCFSSARHSTRVG